MRQVRPSAVHLETNCIRHAGIADDCGTRVAATTVTYPFSLEIGRVAGDNGMWSAGLLDH
jgi:hypothetical protein